MKNFIKIITIFGVAIFVSPLHSMESEQQYYGPTAISGLKKLGSADRFSSLVNNEYFTSTSPRHLLQIGEGLPFQLAMIVDLEKSAERIDGDMSTFT